MARRPDRPHQRVRHAWGATISTPSPPSAPEAILLPKVNDADDIEALARRLDARAETADTTIWAMMETPLGILNAARIAAAPRMAGFVMGTNDLAKELNSRTRGAMTTSLQMCLLAARAHGLVCVDGVYNAFRDEAGWPPNAPKDAISASTARR
jgi:(3S)-malyl-CoA thioesterase